MFGLGLVEPARAGYDDLVLAPDIVLREIDGRHWANWYDLLTPAGVTRHPSWAVVFIEDGRAVRAVANHRGVIPPGDLEFAGTSPQDLVALRNALDVNAVVILSTDALPRLFEEVESALTLDADMV